MEGLIVVLIILNPVMNKVVFLLAMILLVLSCATKKVSQQATVPTDLQGRWLLTLFAYGGKDFAEMFDQRRPELEFHPAENKVSGSTGCNRLTGTYTIKGEGFRFGSGMGLTRMACPGFNESEFIGALNQVNRYRLRDNQLQFYSDSTLIMVYSKTQ